MKATTTPPTTNKAKTGRPAASGIPDGEVLKARKEALERGERAPSRVFRLERQPDGSITRVAVDAESQRHNSANAWEAKSEVAKVRQSLGLTQEAFASLLGIGLSTLRSWEQGKREPSGAARMLITIALKHPEVLQEAVA
ncbi:MAG: helix-turn-helix domain-containing protein [Akkermansiaceae bacterium]|nr:helix-turn-helix domain-containing protein [Akkermansiaceae bacterium]